VGRVHEAAVGILDADGVMGQFLVAHWGVDSEEMGGAPGVSYGDGGLWGGRTCSMYD